MALALTDNRLLRIGTFTSLYFAQGIPIGMITIALPAWLSAAGASAGDIASFTAISGLPWAFKLFAGPLMDRFSYLPMGRRRPWVIAAQGGLLLSLIALACVPEPAINIWLLTWVAFLVNCFSATQDVAVDGMAIDVLPVDERGRANTFMAFGQVAGFSISGILAANLLQSFGLLASASTLSLGVGLIFTWVVIVRERHGERMLPWSVGESSSRSLSLQVESWSEIIKDLPQVLLQPNSILLVLVATCWRMTDGLWVAAVPVISVQELGMDSAAYANTMSVLSFTMATLALFIGPVIDKSGARVFLAIGLSWLAGTYGLAALFSGYWQVPLVAYVIVAATAAGTQILFVAFIAVAMNICQEKVAATQFAVYMALMNLGRSLGAGLYGQIHDQLTSAQIAWLATALCLAALFLLRFFTTEKSGSDKS